MPNWSWSRSNKASPTSKTPSSPGDASKTKYGEPNESPNSNKGTNDNDHQEPQGPRDPAPQSDRIRPRMHDRPDYAVNAYKEGKAAAKNELERKRANGDFAAAIFRAKTEATKAAYRLKEAEAEQEMIHKSFDRQLEESNKKIATTTAFLSGKKKEKSLPDEALATIQARSVEDAEMALRKAREEKEAIESNSER
ncbi:hypothetical protein BJ508DRAFT_155254 [Ascobolus immersus RN42]|uniref:Uncharacterized protein n=1 Tax=Ascobolus immersus RN42 TaxID=1160509 RepID=A0A3N4I380_ASCIM|nr:hypothetical protein BJ508DRAFT_155254 [Ascobolus immersus RN42]